MKMTVTHNLVKYRMLQIEWMRPFIYAFAEAHQRVGDIAFALEEVLPEYVPGKDIIKLMDPAITEHESWHNVDQDAVETWMNN